MKKLVLSLLLAIVGVVAHAQGIQNWSTTAASNTTAVPYGWPTGMNPADIKLVARQEQASIRSWYDDAQWIDGGYGLSYVSSTGFRLAGDRVSIFNVGRRVKAQYGNTNVYGTITSSTYSAPSTTVIIAPDSGSLSSTLSRVWYGAVSNVNSSVVSSTLGLGNMGACVAPYCFDVTSPMFGLVGDGVTDNYTALVSLTNYVSPTGGITPTVYFPAGNYLVSNSALASGVNKGWLVSNTFNVRSDWGARMSFPVSGTRYIEVSGTTPSSIRGVYYQFPLVDGVSPTQRANKAGIHLQGVQDFILDNPRVRKTNGGGVFVNNSISGTVINCLADQTLADGCSTINGSQNITWLNPRAYGTGDDGISIVGYQGFGFDMNKNISIIGALVSNPRNSGGCLAVVGARGVTFDVNCEGSQSTSGAVRIADDTTYNTFGNNGVVGRALVRNTSNIGCRIAGDVSDTTLYCDVAGTSTQRGFTVGNFGTAGASPQNITVGGRVTNAAVTGLDIVGARNVTVDGFTAVSNTSIGINIGSSSVSGTTDGIVLNGIYALNNAGGSTADNVQVVSATNVVMNGVVSFDTRAVALIDQPVDVLSSTNVMVNGFLGLKNGSYVYSPRVQATASNVIASAGGIAYSTTFDPPSISAGALTSTTITVTGAAAGDSVEVGFSRPLQGIVLTGEVTTANTVNAVFYNATGSAIDLASGTLKGMVRKQ